VVPKLSLDTTPVVETMVAPEEFIAEPEAVKDGTVPEIVSELYCWPE
jgi:hypothetical protein